MTYYIYQGRWFYGKMPAPPYYAPVWYCEDGDGSKFEAGDESKNWREVPGIAISKKPASNAKKKKDNGKSPDNKIRKQNQKPPEFESYTMKGDD